MKIVTYFKNKITKKPNKFIDVNTTKFLLYFIDTYKLMIS
jgi:hypothetical protein